MARQQKQKTVSSNPKKQIKQSMRAAAKNGRTKGQIRGIGNKMSRNRGLGASQARRPGVAARRARAGRG